MKKLLFILFLLPLSLFSQVNIDNNKVAFNNGRSTLFFNSVLPTYDNRITYLMIKESEIADTTGELSFFNDTNAIGTRVFPANSLKNGDIIRLTIRSIFNSIGTPTNKIAIYFGIDTLYSDNITLTTGSTQTYAEINIDIKIFEKTGNYYAFCIGKTTLVDGRERTLITDYAGIGKQIDITTDLALDITYSWGTANADNFLKTMIAVIQILN